MTPPVRPLAREDLAVVEIDGEAVIYDEATGDLHHLNPTATIVFALCDGTGTIPELAADLGAAYGVPSDEVEQQLRTVLRTFRRQGLLEGHPKENGNGHG